jgi:hypothetical protein
MGRSGNFFETVFSLSSFHAGVRLEYEQQVGVLYEEKGAGAPKESC